MLRARSLLRKGDRAANREARTLLESAIELDPTQPSAHSLLGLALYDMTQFGWTEFPDATLDRAENEGKRAIALDETEVAGHRLLGRIYIMRGQYERGLAEVEQAVALNPSDADGLRARAWALLWTGKLEEAIDATEKSFRIDPAPHPGAYIIGGMAYYLAKRFEDSAQLVERGLVRFQENGQLLPLLAVAYAQLGRPQEAARAMTTLRHVDPLFDPQAYGSRLQNPSDRALLREGLDKAAAMKPE